MYKKYVLHMSTSHSMRGATVWYYREEVIVCLPSALGEHGSLRLLGCVRALLPL
jgi:hypothetical protein